MKCPAINDECWQADCPSKGCLRERIRAENPPHFLGEKPVDSLLVERGKTHGRYDDDARCAIRLVNVMREEAEAAGSSMNVVQLHALIMICFKIARIVVGDPGFKDHWDDIAGYAKLVANRCKT